MMTKAKQVLVATLQKAINTYLALDPEHKTKLQSLQNKRVTLELQAVNISVQLVFLADNVRLELGDVAPADTVIKGTPLRFLHLALAPREQRKQFFADDITISGDLDLAQAVIDLFDHLEIDWEEHLANYIGDAPAYQIGRVFRQLKNWGEATRDTLLQDVNEFVHEEVPWFPPAEALQDFFHDVDNLRMDTDRLEARLQQLKQRGVK